MKRSLKESPNADAGKSKGPKLIDDCSQPATGALEESNRGPIKGENNIQEEGYGHKTSQGDCEILGIDKGKSLKTGPVAENVQHKNEESGVSRIKSHDNMAVAVKASTSELQKMHSKNPAKKIDPSNPAYMEGTNNVTKSIVDLWRKYRLIEKNGSKDLTAAEVQETLHSFRTDELQTPDEKGYDALLKACCLSSMSPHVMQYLITERKVDVNCQLPSDFDRNYHTIAEGLIPGMSALSVAIRKGNVKSTSTFMTQRDKIKDGIKSADKEGNTALHHCVLSISKVPFMKLFPILEPSEWIEVRNKPKDGKKGKNPLEIAQEMKSSEKLSVAKAQYLQEMLDKMKPNTRYNLFSYW